jgi:Fe-S oxidoreductase
VGCEPSCLFTLRDEHVSMLGSDPDVAAVAGRVQQVEELLTAAIDDGRLVLAEDSPLAGRRILFHGHCHQKAEVGTAATVALLRRIPGAEVVELDAGCCGMAGSFGYEAEHYAVSMKVGADRLFPAIDADADAVLAATGTSCRDQILHGTRRHARHPVELVAEAMRPAGTGTDSTATRAEAGAARRVLHGALGRAVRVGARGARAVRRRAG